MTNTRKASSRNWISLIGQIRPTGDGFVHIPVAPMESVDQRPQFSLAKCDTSFSAGSIEFNFVLTAHDDRVQIVLNHGLDTQVLAGINAQGAAFGILSLRNGQMEPLVTTGLAEHLQLGRTYNLKVQVAGSVVFLCVDAVEVCRAWALIQRSQIAILVSSKNELRISNFIAVPQAAKAFIVMQFSSEFNDLYNNVICPVCVEFGFECIRADDIYNNGLIVDDITRSIREASVVIADITPNNPNVFYEVGFAHGMNKPTILLSDKKRDRLPFDVSGFRTLFYDNTIGGKSAVEERLREHLRNIKA